MELKLSRTTSLFLLIFLLFRILAVGDCGVRLKTNKERRQKLVLINQASLREFHREFKFGMEGKKWRYKHRSHFVRVEKQRI